MMKKKYVQNELCFSWSLKIQYSEKKKVILLLYFAPLSHIFCFFRFELKMVKVTHFFHMKLNLCINHSLPTTTFHQTLSDLTNSFYYGKLVRFFRSLPQPSIAKRFLLIFRKTVALQIAIVAAIIPTACLLINKSFWVLTHFVELNKARINKLIWRGKSTPELCVWPNACTGTTVICTQC